MLWSLIASFGAGIVLFFVGRGLAETKHEANLPEIMERAKRIVERRFAEEVVALKDERNTLLAERDAALAERDARTAERNAAEAERDAGHRINRRLRLVVNDYSVENESLKAENQKLKRKLKKGKK